MLEPFGYLFFFSSRRRHTRFDCDWSSDVCSSDLAVQASLCVPGPSSHSSLTGSRIASPQWVEGDGGTQLPQAGSLTPDRKSTRLNSSHSQISYAVFCLKKKKKKNKKQKK